MDSVTIHWKVVAQYFTVVLFAFLFYPGCNFGKFINLALGTVRSERVNYMKFISSWLCLFQQLSLFPSSDKHISGFSSYLDNLFGNPQNS